ncbi:hypothetical protein C1J03_15855 [Sulfitobacter sp. SK012]|uniref:Hint domain-containing protein n=1 Tax=Sulfitobacter sp. SK012 TaxID=1389005 RepID=UPI000E0BBD2A|nr:Hint domain-containing protein [Sulfitobacter sp. SK012]AXI47352.1 hypothetical protein C1J03_15855 [Sulfitobacter sp. SK012]
MATNSSTTPATEADQSLNGTTSADTLTGGLGNDTITGGNSDDVLRGDGPVEGAWHFETFDRNFSSSSGQAFDIESGVRTGSGYVTDFNEGDLTNTVRGTTGNPEDFGVIYTSTLNTAAGGTYRLTTSSDDGSTIQIFDSSGNALDFANQTGGTRDYLNNDFHQGTTTRFGDVVLDPLETYTIQIRYWENRGGDTLAATISGPDTGGTSQNLLTSPMLGLAPGPEYSVTGIPAGVDGDDSISGGAGNDTILGDGGDDTIFGEIGDDSIDGGTGNDLLDGDVGADAIAGGVGNDTLLGGAGDDDMSGGEGDDSLVGGGDNDTLRGDAGADQLFGGSGDDSLDGGADNDTLTGGTGDDTISGGDGFDTFTYLVGDGADTISDFNTATGQDINDGDQTNNDFLDLSDFYTNLFEVRADLADDNILNQSIGDFSDNTSMAGGSIVLTGVSGSQLTSDNINVACFVAGTQIQTKEGPTAIEDLKPGQHVATLDHGFQPVRQVLQSRCSGMGQMAPVIFSKGTWGAKRDLAVSPMHRMFMADWRAELLFGEAEVLVPTIHLVNAETIYRRPCAQVIYVHLIFDAHEIILAEGIASESFHLGTEAVGDAQTRDELLKLFPELEACVPIEPARRILRGYESALLSHS